MKKQFVFVLMAVFLVGVVSASGVDTVVSGKIYDEDGLVIEGADVTVVCNGRTETSVSSSSGAYSVVYSSGCFVGDEVIVSAVKGDLSGSDSGSVEDFGLSVNVAVANVHMTPEFGVLMGALTLFASAGIFLFVRRD